MTVERYCIHWCGVLGAVAVAIIDFPKAMCRSQVQGTVRSLDLLNAKFFPKRYWRGPKPQELGEEGAYI